MSALVWWQQSRAADRAKADQQKAIQETSQRVAGEVSGKVTGILNREYGTLIGSLYGEIGTLSDQVQGQSALRKQEVALKYTPALDLVYAGSQLQLWNHGRSIVSIWGDKYSGAPRDVNKAPDLISPTAYYYFLTDRLLAAVTSKLGRNGEDRIPFDVYIATADNARYVVHYELWEVMKDGQLSIHTQNHGFDKMDWSKQ